jgi:hypothetical protein
VSLDDAIRRFGTPAYCKIDVEGWEYDVLCGLSQMVPLISFEYHLNNIEIQKSFHCLNYLSNFGEIEINIKPENMTQFLLKTWVSHDSFRILFPDQLDAVKHFDYGEIFVRTH